MPNAASAAPSRRVDLVGAHQRWRATTDVDAAEARRAPAQLDLDDQRVDEIRDPVLRPARGAPAVDDEVAVRTDTDRQNGKWTYSATGGGRQSIGRGQLSGPGSGRRLPIPRASILRVLLDDFLVEAADGVTWPAWPVATKIAKRVTAWASRIAPMPPVMTVSQPPTRPMPSDSHSISARPARRTESRRQRVQHGLEADRAPDRANSRRAAGQAGCRARSPHR